ncbi:hypothetical protein ACVXHB_11170 [Escherichia coli]
MKDKKTFCSSATGEMDIPLNELIPALDINKTSIWQSYRHADGADKPQSSSGIATLC